MIFDCERSTGFCLTTKSGSASTAWFAEMGPEAAAELRWCRPTNYVLPLMRQKKDDYVMLSDISYRLACNRTPD
jgi:hypothetical protein